MTQPPPTPWIEPTQARSRTKVDRLLKAALEIALENQSLDLKVTEVAKRAGVAIGTLYQFFPSRSALIAKLFAQEMQPIDAIVSEALTGATTLLDLNERISYALRASFKLADERPGLKIIWTSANIDPVIEAADFANTRQNANLLASRIIGLTDRQDRSAEISATALLICHLWSSVIRLCALVEVSEKQFVLDQYSKMIARHSMAITRPK